MTETVAHSVIPPAQLNKLLNRTTQEEEFKRLLTDVTTSSNRKGIYIYGGHGIGKTSFVTHLLRELNYDMIKYDAGDMRNANMIADIASQHMGDRNVLSMLEKRVKRIAIVMDEIDGMNNGDKGGINTLIKLIRPKKTKRQKQEEFSNNPVICIGNYRADKKMKELMKVCHIIELPIPTKDQMSELVSYMLTPENNSNKELVEQLVNFAQNDLRKFHKMCDLFNRHPEFFHQKTMDDLFVSKNYDDNTKKIVHNLFERKYSITNHDKVMGGADRTSVGLLWHENVVDFIRDAPSIDAVPFYLRQLENICLADFIDRVTFQKQIWQFNEMSSLVKTLYNHTLYHQFKKSHKADNCDQLPKVKKEMGNHSSRAKLRKEPRNGCLPVETHTQAREGEEIRFTKVLTKYSTEYNNMLFIYKLCQRLSTDKKDLFGYMSMLKQIHKDDTHIYEILNEQEISKLDITRFYKYMDKYIKDTAYEITSDDLDIEEIEEHNIFEIPEE